MFPFAHVLTRGDGKLRCASIGWSEQNDNFSAAQSNARGPTAHTASGLIAVLGYAELIDFDFRIAGESCESSWD